MSQVNKNSKIADLLSVAFMVTTIVLALVVYISMQILNDNQRKYSKAVLSEIATNHAHMVHLFLENSKGQAKNFVKLSDGSFVFDSRKALASIIDPALKNHIEFYILNNKGIVINAIGEDFEKGINALKVLGLKDYDIAKPFFGDVVLHAQKCFVSLAPMPNKDWTAVALLPVDALRSDTYTALYYVLIVLGLWIVFCTSFACFFMYNQRKAYSLAQNYAEKAHQILDEIPCGIVRCANDEQWTILDYTESLPSILGVSEDEIALDYNNCWRDLIHPDDRGLVKAMEPKEGESVMSAEYRIVRKNGDSVYIMDRTRLIENEDKEFLWCVIIDVNDLKISQAQEHNMVGRYKHLLEMSGNILYEYDIEDEQFGVSLEFFKKFEYSLPEDEGHSYYPILTNVIHPEDMDLFSSMQMRIKVGGKVAAALLRIKKYNDEWNWCQLRQTSWRDNQGRLKAIGTIDNVDKETRKLQKLQDDVQRDSFTSLYNKVATEQLINREIALNPDNRGAFCIIDIDNFKHVNNSFGHAMGDIVIKKLANGLSQIFRSNDIVGRIGGDEFIVYIKNMRNLRPLLQKIDSVHAFFRQTFEDNNVKVSISCSIGIALSPKDGGSYDEIYRNADKALYRSKMTKDVYQFYDPEIDL